MTECSWIQSTRSSANLTHPQGHRKQAHRMDHRESHADSEPYRNSAACLCSRPPLPPPSRLTAASRRRSEPIAGPSPPHTDASSWTPGPHLRALALEAEVRDHRRVRPEVLGDEQRYVAHVLHLGQLGRVVYLPAYTAASSGHIRRLVGQERRRLQQAQLQETGNAWGAVRGSILSGMDLPFMSESQVWARYTLRGTRCVARYRGEQGILRR